MTFELPELFPPIIPAWRVIFPVPNRAWRRGS